MTKAPEPVPDIFEHFGDLFGELFGTGRPEVNRRQIRQTLHIELSDASEGAHHSIEIERYFQCDVCKGRGAPEDATATECQSCKGRRKTQQQQGLFTMFTPCADCRGRGERFDPECSACEGQGGESRTETIDVQIPGGVADGQVMVFEGKGNELSDGEGPGDLVLELAVGPDPRFRREGDDLHVTVTLDEATAEGGGTVRVPVPGGEVELEVSPRTERGTTLRMPGFGALKLGSPPVPRPTGNEVPYRSIEPSEHRGELVVTFAYEGDAPSNESLYAALGLSAGASVDDVTRAYRQLAMQLHPDRNPGDAAAARRFAEVSAAYSTLRSSLGAAAAAPSHAESRGSPWVVVAIVVIIMAAVLVLARG